MERITGPQLHAARVLLGWSRRDVADRSKLDLDIVEALETSARPHRVSRESCAALCAVFEAAGVEFGNERGIGVAIPRPSNDLDEQISDLEGRLATRVTDGDISPKGGMQRLRQGNDENELRKLKARKRKQ